LTYPQPLCFLSFYSLPLPPPTSPLFPYTTLFRSRMRPPHIHFDVTGKSNRLVTQMYFAGEPLNDKDPFLQGAGAGKERLIVRLRSEEHTSELQSLRHLVCRLLLEKKKTHEYARVP